MPHPCGRHGQRFGSRRASHECPSHHEVQIRHDSERDGGRDYLKIAELTVADIDTDENQLGFAGSPTKVKKIENVVFQAKEAKCMTAADENINELMVELIASHTLG